MHNGSLIFTFNNSFKHTWCDTLVPENGFTGCGLDCFILCFFLFLSLRRASSDNLNSESVGAQGNFMGRPGFWHGGMLFAVPLFPAQGFRVSASDDETHLSEFELVSSRSIQSVFCSQLFPEDNGALVIPRHFSFLPCSDLTILSFLAKKKLWGPGVTRSFWITTFGYNEPSALHALPFSKTFTLSFSSLTPLRKASTIGLVFGVWSGIFFLLTFFGGDIFFPKCSVHKTDSPIPASFTFPLSGEHNTVLSLWPRSKKEKTRQIIHNHNIGNPPSPILLDCISWYFISHTIQN